MVENDSKMLLQIFLHLDKKGDPLVEEVSLSDGKLFCTCGTRGCTHLGAVAKNLPQYLALPEEHTPAQRREHVIRNMKTLVLK